MFHTHLKQCLIACMALSAMFINGCSCNPSTNGTPDAGVDAGTDSGVVDTCAATCTDVGQICTDAGACVCGPGYVWNDFDSICEPVNCPALTITNGTVNPTGVASYGDVVTFGCNTDFQLQGDATRTCGDAGQWTGTMPICVAITGVCASNPCGSNGQCIPNGASYLCECNAGWMGPNCDMPVMCTGLVDPLNGSVTPTSALPDGVATYTCQTGYALNGSATTTCLSTGLWDNAPPTCEPVACPTLAAPANGSLSATTGTFGQTTTYSCDGGYALNGSPTRTCQADGTWSGADATCVVANNCSANPCQNGATCTDAVPGPGYSCACTAGWSGPNCDVPVDCGALSSPSNGNVSTTSTTFGGTATYACISGYQLTGNAGSAMRSCQADGSWSGTEPTCAPLSCTASAPTNGSVDNPMPVIGGEVVYSCDTGYVRNGDLARTCLADQTLSGIAPTCEPVVCNASAPQNGLVSAPSATYLGSVSYSCNDGFMLASGDSTRICQADGSLSGTEPTCLPVIGGCTANPCVNGSCTDVGAGYSCSCDAGWSGPNCDVPVDCGNLPNPTNGIVQTGATTLGNDATYSCNSGYALTGSATRTCGTDGNWSASAPTCDPITCSGLTAPANGSISSTSATYTNSVTYACDMGYVLSGNGGLATRSCQADGSFSGVAPNCAPVDCGALAAPANGSVTGGTTYTSTATYSCNGGYMLVGSSTSTCTADGTWSGTPPTCEPIPMPCTPNPCNGGTCTPGTGTDYTCSNCPTGYGGSNCDVPVSCSGAAAPTNGTVSATTATYNQVITYACNSGYDLVGTATRTCQADGTFGGTAPTCAPVTCSGLVAPTNGSVSATSTTFGNSVSYSCASGYELNGNTTRTCQADGTFGGTAPTCDPVDCGPLTAPTNGSVSTPTTTYGSTATYSCDAGYALTGTSTRTCQATTAWSDTAPTCTLIMTGCSPNPCANGGTCTPSGASGFTCDCSGAVGWTGSTCSTPVTCSGASAPTNGAVSSSSTTYNSSVTYSCNAGYTLVGSSSRLCQADGSFAGTAPTCQAVTCSGASAPTNGSVSATSATYPNSITYACNSGYVLTGNGGSSTRTCQADTTFSGTAPTCAPVTCTGAVAPSNGNVTSTSATFGNSVTYSCDAGYTLVGTATATCQADATFSSAPPSCAPVSCPSLVPPTNGSVTAPSTTYGSTAMYSCDSGYSLSGSATTTCQADQTWSNPAPTCTLVPMPCTPNPCLNGGSCTPGSGMDYTCTCQPGYEGTNCGTPVTCTGASAPTNGTVSATSATYTNSITYSCNSGYMLSGGSSTRTCQADATFSGTAPTCAPVVCSGATAPLNGTVSSSSTTYPNSITYTCNSGYTLTGSSTQDCTAAGTFSGSAPTCTPVNCGAPSILNGTVSAPVTTYGATATYSCSANYSLQGSATGTCQANGTWTTPPTCVYDCGALTAPTNGTVMTSPNTLDGATATYTCSAGYTMTGSATRTCAVGGWSGSAPTCTAPQRYCDVVYRTATGTTEHGVFHIYNNSIAAISASPAIGINDLLPQYGNTPNFITMNTPFTPAAYPTGWIRMRYNANAAGTAPVAGPVRLIEFFAPVDATPVNLSAGFLGSISVRIAIDGAAGLLQTTTVGCPGGAARCPVLVNNTPVIQRTCGEIATGTVSGTSITWDTCSIPAPAGTTGTPNSTQLNWTPAQSVAMPAPADPGCVRDMVAWGGISCLGASGLASCGSAGALTTSPTSSVWDQKLPTITLSGTNYATANGTIPEFIIPETDANTYTGARVNNAPVVRVECGTLAELTCDDQ